MNKTARLLMFLLTIPALLTAEEGSWGTRGFGHDFAIRNNLLLAADGRGLAIYDISSPAAIRRLDVAETDDESLAVTTHGAEEVLLLSRASLRRYIVSNSGLVSGVVTMPLAGATQLASNGSEIATATAGAIRLWTFTGAAFQPAGSLPVTDAVHSLAFRGRTLYAAVNRQGVYAFDTRTATQVGFLPVAALGMAVQGDFLHAASGPNGLVVASISDPARPSVSGRLGEINMTDVAAGDGVVWAIDERGKLHQINVISPSEPRLVRTIEQPVQVVAARGTTVFVSGEAGVPLRAIDSTGRVAGEVRDLAGPVSGVATDGTLAYVADAPAFRIIDVSNPAAPRELSSIVVPGLQDRVRLRDGLVIVYGRGDINLIDVSNPYEPRHLSTYQSLGEPPCHAVFAGDTILHANPLSGFHVIDYSDRARPVQISGLKGNYFELNALGQTAYLFLLASLRLVDVSNRFDAQRVADLSISPGPNEVVPGTAAHPPLLLLKAPDRLRIFSLATPLAPRELAALPLATDAVLGASRDAAFLAIDGLMHRLDLTRPGDPSLVDVGVKVRSPLQVAVSGEKVVVADRYSLRVFGPRTAPPPPPQQPRPPRRRATR